MSQKRYQKAVTPGSEAKASGPGAVFTRPRKGWRRTLSDTFPLTRRGYDKPRHGTVRQVEV